MAQQSKNRTSKIAIAVLSIIIVLSNTPPAQYFLLESYGYTNGDNSFRYSEEPGQALDFKVGQIRWKRFKSEHPDRDHTLYRTFRIRPWQFWEWWQYVAHGKRFALPYKSP